MGFSLGDVAKIAVNPVGYLGTVGVDKASQALGLGSPLDFLGGLMSPTTVPPTVLPGIIPQSQAASYIKQAVGQTGSFTEFLRSPAIAKMFTTASPTFKALLAGIKDPSSLISPEISSKLLAPITSAVQARANKLGIGDSPLASTISAAASPALLNFAQQQIANLTGAAQIEGAKSQDFLSYLGLQQKAGALDFSTLLGAAEFGKPTVLPTQQNPPQLGVGDIISAAGLFL